MKRIILTTVLGLSVVQMAMLTGTVYASKHGIVVIDLHNSLVQRIKLLSANQPVLTSVEYLEFIKAASHASSGWLGGTVANVLRDKLVELLIAGRISYADGGDKIDWLDKGAAWKSYHTYSNISPLGYDRFKALSQEQIKGLIISIAKGRSEHYRGIWEDHLPEVTSEFIVSAVEKMDVGMLENIFRLTEEGDVAVLKKEDLNERAAQAVDSFKRSAKLITAEAVNPSFIEREKRELKAKKEVLVKLFEHGADNTELYEVLKKERLLD